MNKREFVRRCAESTNLSQRQVLDVMNYFLDAFNDELQTNGSAHYFDLGRFDVVQRKSKNHYDFVSGDIKPGRQYQTIRFRPCRKMVSNID